MPFSSSAIRVFARNSGPALVRAVPLVLVAALCCIVLNAGFFAPYDYQRQNRSAAFSPPTRIHFLDIYGRFHLRPFIYKRRAKPGSFSVYEEDRSSPHPLPFLVPGPEYALAGLFPARIHFFGPPPGTDVFLMGSDGLGRDIFSRLLFGAQISLLAPLLATAIAVSLGLLVGSISGYFSRWTDELIMRLAELLLSVPWLYLLLLVRAFLPLHLGPQSVFLLLMAVSGVVGWGRPARLVRNLVATGRKREYVLAAQGFGASHFYVLRRHILPQGYAISLTQAALYIPQYITAEVTLSYFGLGVSEPAPSWGNMLAQVRTLFVLENCWWMFAPAVALMAVLLLFETLFRVRLGSLPLPPQVALKKTRQLF